MKIFSLLNPILLFLQVIFIRSNEDEFRIVKLNDFSGENSYLPVKCGQKFIIEIAGNPTTGYVWTLEGSSENDLEKLVTPLNLNEKNSAEYYSNNKQSSDNEIMRVGVGGIYHFKFQAHETKSGHAELTFIYKRPWSDEGASKRKVVIKVVNLDEPTIEL